MPPSNETVPHHSSSFFFLDEQHTYIINNHTSCAFNAQQTPVAASAAEVHHNLPMTIELRSSPNKTQYPILQSPSKTLLSTMKIITNKNPMCSLLYIIICLMVASALAAPSGSSSALDGVQVCPDIDACATKILLSGTKHFPCMTKPPPPPPPAPAGDDPLEMQLPPPPLCAGSCCDAGNGICYFYHPGNVPPRQCLRPTSTYMM